VRLFDWIAWRGRRDDDLQQEIASHLAMAAHERIADGEDPRAAQLAAHREFGNIMRTREATRLMWNAAWLDRLSEWWRDARYAARLLRKSPGSTKHWRRGSGATRRRRSASACRRPTGRRRRRRG
jgi:hypothetical protein